MQTREEIWSRLRTELVITYCIFCLALSSMVARLFTRWRLVSHLGLDDLLALSAFLIGIGMTPPQHLMTRELKLAVDILLAEHPNPSPRYLPHQEEVLKAQYIASAFYLVAIGIVKLSILAFYRRFLPPRPYLRILHIISAVIFLFTLITFFFEVFQCLPVHKVWDIYAKCKIKAPILHLVTSVFHLLTDFVILFLPMRVVWRLHASLRRRLALMLVFALGALGTISTAIRMWKTLAVVFAFLEAANTSPVGWLPLVTTTVMWSQVEVNLIVFCANLPALSSLWHFFRDPNRSKAKSRGPSGNASNSYQLESHKGSRMTASSSNKIEATSSQEQIIPNYHQIMRSTTLDVRIDDIEPVQPLPKV